LEDASIASRKVMPPPQRSLFCDGSPGFDRLSSSSRIFIFSREKLWRSLPASSEG
jgi:hypothetical protein